MQALPTIGTPAHRSGRFARFLSAFLSAKLRYRKRGKRIASRKKIALFLYQFGNSSGLLMGLLSNREVSNMKKAKNWLLALFVLAGVAPVSFAQWGTSHPAYNHTPNCCPQTTCETGCGRPNLFSRIRAKIRSCFPQGTCDTCGEGSHRKGLFHRLRQKMIHGSGCQSCNDPTPYTPSAPLPAPVPVDSPTPDYSAPPPAPLHTPTPIPVIDRP